MRVAPVRVSERCTAPVDGFPGCQRCGDTSMYLART